MTHKKIRKAVFPVAGLGTRFLPATKVLPKEMLVLGDKPLIQHAIEEAAAAGIEEFLLVSGRGKGIMEDHFKSHGELEDILRARGRQDRIGMLESSNIPEGRLFVTYQGAPLGLGHAVWCAKSFVGDEPFAVILPDDVVLADRGCMTQLVEAYGETGGNLVAVEDVPREETYKYGVLDVESERGRLVEIRGLVEKPVPEMAPSTLSIIGRYILQPEILDRLSGFEKGSGGEIQLTDAMARLIGTQPFHGLRFDGVRCDCGSALGLIEASLEYALRREDLAARVRAMLEARLPPPSRRRVKRKART